MKKTKRILAIIGIIVLLGMVITTLILAFVDTSEGMWMFKASIGCTILLPVLLYAYTLVYKITRPDDKDDPTKEA